MSKNLNTKVTRTATSWKTKAKQDHNNRRAITRAQLFALDLMDYMDNHNIKQKELAEKMDVSPQQVNKILRAKSNLTFETIDKIEAALGVVITTPMIKVQVTSSSQTVGEVMQVVYRCKPKAMETDILSTSVTKKNPLLKTSIESMNEYRFTADQF